jgi:hypothetical protein
MLTVYRLEIALKAEPPEDAPLIPRERHVERFVRTRLT